LAKENKKDKEYEFKEDIHVLNNDKIKDTEGADETFILDGDTVQGSNQNK
jgi:hypothetical protein